MEHTKLPDPVFQMNDEVILATGPNWGTPGTFRQLRDDPKWADITERDGSVRSHPVEWLAKAK